MTLSDAYPADGSLYYELGRIYAEAEDYTRAIPQFMAAITVEPWYVEAYLALGDAYLGEGYSGQARETYVEGLEVTRRERKPSEFTPQFQQRIESLERR